jgi:deoxyribodipyrimidine photo-lyase
LAARTERPQNRVVNVLHWFRGDLRLRDNTALASAASSADKLAFLFVLDERLLRSERIGEPRLRFLRGCLEALAAGLQKRGHRLILRRGDPRREVAALAEEIGATRVSWNRDTTPYARRRDAAVRAALAKLRIGAHESKDRVVFEAAELRSQAGRAYQVFTPFRRAWLARHREAAPTQAGPLRLPAPLGASATTLGLAALPADEAAGECPAAGEAAARRRLAHFVDGAIGDYAQARDVPSIDGTSRLSHHLRFGTLSPRACVAAAREAALLEPRLRAGAAKWIDELVWRDFYASILEEHPHVLERSFRREYDDLAWNDDEPGFAAWCAGRTGYPLVDAGMRQLAQTGWMHNRARMIAASFLVKDLLIDWRRGERWFLQRLVDGDPASNNGGWQWCASTGTDAQPYFRIFSPTSQGERFDPAGTYVRRWIPELRDVPERFIHAPSEAPTPPRGYPAPIVSHAQRRILALARFEAARKRGQAATGAARR